MRRAASPLSGASSSSAFSDPEGLFYLTRHLAHLNAGDAALELFERVVGGGIFCYPAMSSDPWLDPIRDRPKFVRMIERAEQQHQAAASEFARLDGNRILGSERAHARLDRKIPRKWQKRASRRVS